MVPSGWNKKRIDSLGNVITGSTPSTLKPEYWGDKFPFITPSDIVNSRVDITERYLSDKGSKFARILPPNSIVFVCIGSTIGKIGYSPNRCTTNQQSNSVIPHKDNYWKYIFYALTFVAPKIKRLAGVTAIPIISKSQFSSLTLNVPTSKREQHKIATILSAWDKAIEQVQRLIDAKTRLKRGLMQQLLTGKRRFKEFGKDWQEVRCGDIFRERKETDIIDLQLISVTSEKGVISREEVDRKDTSNEDKSKYKRIAPGDIGYNTMRMWQGVSGLSTLEGIVSPAYTILIPSDKIDAKYASYFFKYAPIIHLFYRYSQGLVDDTRNLKYRNFAQIKVKIPELKEQTRIARVFESIDKEINNLENCLGVFQTQKKGLMQVLLTGKLRVKIKTEGT